MKRILLISTYSNQPKQFNQSLNQLKTLYNREIQNSNENNKIKLHKSNAIEELINHYKMLEQKSKRGNDTGNINNQNGLNFLNDLDNFENLEALLNETTVHFVDLINNKNDSDNTESIEIIKNKEDIINMYKKMNSSNIYDIHRIAHSHKPSSLSKEELDMFLTGAMYFLTLEYNNFKNINK